MKQFLEKYEGAIVCALLLCGFAVRLLNLTGLPWGLNQDEASAGYEAWSLLHYGIDRCGNAWPVLLESWGSGQNVLYTCLCIPFVAVLGLTELSIRLPMAITGCATLIVFWRLARLTRGKTFGLCALFLLTVNPWHIMASRWALESNLLPVLLLLGVYCVIRAKTTSVYYLFAATVCFGLSAYAYGTAFVFLPLFLIGACIWLRKEIRANLPCFLGALAVFAALIFPIALCQLRNALGLGELTILGVTLPKLSVTRQSSTTALSDGFSAILRNAKECIKLLIKQRDGYAFNYAANGGLYYLFGLPLALIGLIVSFTKQWREPREAAVQLALFVCVPAVLIIDPNVNRVNMLWLPLLYFMALGLWFLCNFIRRFGLIPIVGVLVCFCLFLSSYSKEFGKQHGGNDLYFPGVGACIEYCKAREAESVYITNHVTQPYIYALFYTQTPPGEFADTVDYIDMNADLRKVRSFGKFSFGSASQAAGDYLILHRTEADSKTAVFESGDYVVCQRGSSGQVE